MVLKAGGVGVEVGGVGGGWCWRLVVLGVVIEVLPCLPSPSCSTPPS